MRHIEGSFGQQPILVVTQWRTEGEPDFQEARVPSRDELAGLLDMIITPSAIGNERLQAR